MVRRIFGFFYKETHRLHQAALLLAFFSLLSQLLGFVRDRSLAHYFGASTHLDVYYAAFKVPDLIFVTFASVVSLSVLVPFIIERESEGRENVKKFVDDIFSFFSLFILISCLAFFWLMPEISKILFKGFEPEALKEVVYLSRILLLSPIFLGVSNLFGSLTQAYNRFLVYAFAPVLYNLGIIIGIFAFARGGTVSGVAWGVVLGSVLHLVIQIPFVIKMQLMPRFKLFDWTSIKRVIMHSMPRTITLSLSQLSGVFLVSLASLMTAGSISIFTFAQNIASVPLSIIGVSYSLAAFPTLSRHFSQNNLKDFFEQMSITVRHIIFWSLPIIALFVVLRAQIVRVLLGTGNFDWADTRLTAASLAIFALSVLSQSLVLLFIRAFYSAGHTRKPFLISIFSTLFLILASYFSVKLFYFWPTFGLFVSSLLKVEDLSGTVVLMLPLGFSLGTILSSVVYWFAFEKVFGKFGRETYHTLFVSLSTAVFVGLGSYVGLNLFKNLFNLDTLLGIFGQGLSAGILGSALGMIVLWLLRSVEFKELWQALHQKLGKVEAVAENQEIV
jgi:putative peptidoglycan lipid II flippase